MGESSSWGCTAGHHDNSVAKEVLKEPQHLGAVGPSDRDRKGITSLSFLRRKHPRPDLRPRSRLLTGRSRRFALVHLCTSPEGRPSVPESTPKLFLPPVA